MIVELRRAIDTWIPGRIIVSRHRSIRFLDRLDSATEAVLRESPVPVLVLHPSRIPQIPSKARDVRILFPTSLDREAEEMVGAILRVTAKNGLEVSMLHIVDLEEAPLSWGERVCMYAEQRFSQILRDYKAHNVHTLVRYGNVPDTVAHVAGQSHDLIVLGVRSGASFRNDIRPGVAYKIVCEAPCPVLVYMQEPAGALRYSPGAAVPDLLNALIASL